MEKVWLDKDSIDELTRMLRVRDKDSTVGLGIDVLEQSVFILSFGGQELIAFNKEEMKTIYNFLKQYYE